MLRDIDAPRSSDWLKLSIIRRIMNICKRDPRVVYTLLDVDRGGAEVWGGKYDVRELLRACYYALDKKPLTDAKLLLIEKEAMRIALKKVRGTDIEILLKESGLIE